MPSVAEYQQKFDEISAIRQAAKNDYSIPNSKRREIAEEYRAAGKELRAASAAAMAAAASKSSTAHRAAAAAEATADQDPPNHTEKEIGQGGKETVSE